RTNLLYVQKSDSDYLGLVREGNPNICGFVGAEDADY
ncbi:MAG: hypothetical protein EZS28_032313, partial [Streblomastix strix]